MHLTPDDLERAYEYLRGTLPFRRWKLPDSDKLEFRVTHVKGRHGHFKGENPGAWPNITISSYHVKTTCGLMATMAHEMVHVYLDRTHPRAAHGTPFKRRAALVCKRHGFDLEAF